MELNGINKEMAEKHFGHKISADKWEEIINDGVTQFEAELAVLNCIGNMLGAERTRDFQDIGAVSKKMAEEQFNVEIASDAWKEMLEDDGAMSDANDAVFEVISEYLHLED